MTQQKQPTNGAGGLKWSTISKILKALPSAGYVILVVLGVGLAQYVQVALMGQKIETHIAADKERDDRVEARVHAVELIVAAMKGGE